MSITGPYRRGKSYILSEVFDQPDVFPLGHSLDAETMGIWMWIVPGKFLVGGPIHFVSSHLSFLNGCQPQLSYAWVCFVP